MSFCPNPRDRRNLPVIKVAFLNGQKSPTIETAEADFNVLGVQMAATTTAAWHTRTSTAA